MFNPEIHSGSNEQQKFEDVNKIILQEISPDEALEGDLEIIIDSEASQSEVEARVKEKLKKENWWLQKYWQTKEIPREKVTIQMPACNIELFNFGKTLEAQHIQELELAVKFFAKLSDEFLNKVTYILADNEQKNNPNTGEEMSGHGPVHEKAVKIYPKGMEFSHHRVPTASNFLGTLIHEISHCASTEFKNEWIKRFGWSHLEKPQQLPGGALKYFEVDNPQECVTDYAKVSPDEDICESMVALATNFEGLNKEKKEFIINWFDLESMEKENIVSIIRNQDSKIKLPTINQPVRYFRKQPKKFAWNNVA